MFCYDHESMIHDFRKVVYFVVFISIKVFICLPVQKIVEDRVTMNVYLRMTRDY